MDIVELQEMINRDLKIDPKQISKTIVEIPTLHSKYLVLLQREQLRAIRQKSKLEKMYREKYIYYRNDYNIILKNKAEIDVLINGDEEYQLARDSLELQKNICAILEAAIKQISGMSFLIKDYIEWEKFKQGS